MASSKLTALSAAVPVGTDILYFVSDPGGTPLSKKCLASNFVLVSGLGTGVITALAQAVQGSGKIVLSTGPITLTNADVAAYGLALVNSNSGNPNSILLQTASANLTCRFLSGTGEGYFGIYGDAMFFEANSTLSTGFLFFTDNGTALQIVQTGKVSIGIGTPSPTYGLHVAPTSGVTALQTVKVQDATASTGSTRVLLVAGAGQGSDPILEVSGDITSTGANVGTLTNCPHTGNPALYWNVKINGTVYAIPAFALT